jgi:ubiquinone/menaquinone biosynthesis C-methylase UbiE
MENEAATTPEGLRDANEWYLDVDPLAIVDQALLDYVDMHGGHDLLDLGCGLGGYAHLLAKRGHTVKALDVNPEYVRVARDLGVDAETFDGTSIPLPDDAVDTVFMVEVLEHVPQPERILPELRRVARRNVIITVPNNTQSFAAPVEWSHMLEVDHKNFFTRDSLQALLRSTFGTVEVTEVAPIDGTLARDLLPRWLWVVHRALAKVGLVRDRHFFRLIAQARP